MSGPLKFDVKKLREKGQSRVSKVLEPDEFQECLAGGAALRGPVTVTLEFAARGDGVVLRGAASGAWDLECCRCLGPRPASYRAKIEAFVEGEEGEIDAAEEVRQALVLALPMRSYCRPDCKGLCVKCGANKNLRDCGCPPQPVLNALKKGDSHA